MTISFWGGLALGIIGVLVVVIWSIRHHRTPTLEVDCDACIGDLMPSLAGLTLGTPTRLSSSPSAPRRR